MLDTSTTNQDKIMRLKEMLRETSSPNKMTNQQDILSNQKPMIKRQPQNNIFPLEQRCLQIEAKINTRIQQEWRLYQNICLEVMSLEQQARILKKQIDRSKQTAQQKASALQRQFSEEVTVQIEEIKFAKKEIIQCIESKYKTIKTETMVVISSQFESGWDEARQDIITSMEEVKAKMEREEAGRDQVVAFMVGSFGEEILKVQQLVLREKEQRIQSHKRLISAIANVEDDISTSILMERRQSSSAISGLEGYLEQLCFKIQNHILR